MTAWPTSSLRHLARLSDERGVFEHARLDEPRRDAGYCTDDAGRALALAVEHRGDPAAERLTAITLAFLARAHHGGGEFRIRLGQDGRWTEDPPSDDAAGRALLGLGTAAAAAADEAVRSTALRQFDSAAAFRSPHPRALAYAALGAARVLEAYPDHAAAGRLVGDAAALLPRLMANPAWPWPAPRLTYANALLPDALLAVGATEDGLAMLAWLAAEESNGEWFSFTPVAGRGPGDSKPAFDQQPIEAWAMAEACARAYRVTGDPHWADEARRAGRWFLGENDARTPMFDPRTGGGYDGLERGGVNRNEGAESTMAFVGTMAAVRAVERLERLRQPALATRPQTGRRADG